MQSEPDVGRDSGYTPWAPSEQAEHSPCGAQCTGMFFFHRTRNTSKYPVKVLTGLHSSVCDAVRFIIRYNMFLVFLRALLKQKGAFPLFHFLEIAVLPSAETFVSFFHVPTSSSRLALPLVLPPFSSPLSILGGEGRGRGVFWRNSRTLMEVIKTL